MLDPFTALGCASAVVQFVDFGVKIIGCAFELHKAADGVSQSNTHVSGLCDHLQFLSQNIEKHASRAASSGADANGELQLLDLCHQGQELATEISQLLETLRVDHSRKFVSWQALRKAIRSARKADQLQSLRTRMGDLRSGLTLHMMYLMGNTQNSVAKAIDSLSDQCQKMRADHLDLVSYLQDELNRKTAVKQDGDREKCQRCYDHALSCRYQSGAGRTCLQCKKSGTTCCPIRLTSRGTLPRRKVWNATTEDFSQYIHALYKVHPERNKRAPMHTFELHSMINSNTKRQRRDLDRFINRVYSLEDQFEGFAESSKWNSSFENSHGAPGDAYDRTLTQQGFSRLRKAQNSYQEDSITAGDFYSVVTGEAPIAFRDDLLRVAKVVEAAVLGAQATSTALKILNTLFFPELPMRHMDIPETYRSTYGWIFDAEASPFAEWMLRGTGVFWLNGKAGSGKSTMMKFLSEDPRTTSHLKKWTHGERLCILKFYFWNAGYAMQKTQKGLLQSLLFQIFRECPEVIKVACPQRWRSPEQCKYDPWTHRELEDALCVAFSHQNPPRRVCIFIDGLDEFIGDQSVADHHSLNTFLAKLAQSNKVKICISSRPHNVFKNRFGGDQNLTLRLEDLNRQDMDIYVKGMLEEEPMFKRLTQSHHEAAKLALEIREAADGVFLWVFLVVRSLLRGLSENDDITTLQQRLREMPKTLDEFFKRILDNIESIYKERTARSLLLAITADEPLPILTYYFVVLEMESADFAVRIRQTRIDNKSFETMSAYAATSINKWCRDFLVVKDNWFGNTTKDLLLSYKVNFLHRTAKDFLRNEAIMNGLWRNAVNYVPQLTLCRSFLAHYKYLGPKDRGPDRATWDYFHRKAVKYAHECEGHGCPTPTAEIQQLGIPPIALPYLNIPQDEILRHGRHRSTSNMQKATPQHQGNSTSLTVPYTTQCSADDFYSISDSEVGHHTTKLRRRDKFKSMFLRVPISGSVTSGERRGFDQVGCYEGV